MTSPDFRKDRAELDGFRQEKKKPMKSNMKAFTKFLTLNGDMLEYRQYTTWNEVIRETYNRLAFFRKYYCGEDIPEIIADGGLRPDFLRPGDNLFENHWIRAGKALIKYGEAQQNG